MPSLLKRLISLLWTIAYCASCASVPQTCVQCSLSCDGEPVLEKHDRVIVSIKHPLQDIPDKVYNVSSLFDVGSCLVPGCFQRDALYILKIYANNDDPVPEVLVDEPNLRPDCGPEGVSVRKDPNGAGGKHCNKLLFLLACCFWIVFHLEGPR